MSAQTVVQCSRSPIKNYIVEQLMESFPGWDYAHFNDSSMREFIINNPLEEFPDAEKRLGLFTRGAHKADYFRYFYLYSRGGFFVDSDLMIEQNITDDVESHDFISAINKDIENGRHIIFQGLLYCKPGNKIVRQALENLYTGKIHDLQLVNDYHASCRDMYKIIASDTEYKKKLYVEKPALINDEEFRIQHASLILDGNSLIGVHYFENKEIPRKPMKSDNGKRIVNHP